MMPGGTQPTESMPTGIEVLRESRMSRLVVSAGGMTWMKRRVVVTNEDILFSNVGCERVVDQISLVHVKRVAGMNHDPFKASPIDLKDQVQGNGFDADKRCMIVIHTVPDGVDAGLHTVLLAESVEKANEWVSLVSGLSRQAFHTMPQSRPIAGSFSDKKQQGFISMSSRRPTRPQVQSMDLSDVPQSAPRINAAEEQNDTRVPGSVFGAGARIKSTADFMGKREMSATESIRKQGILSKRIASKDIVWKERYVTLTDDKIYIRNEDGGQIRDTLQLLQITRVNRMVKDQLVELLLGQKSKSNTGLSGSLGAGLNLRSKSRKNAERKNGTEEEEWDPFEKAVEATSQYAAEFQDVLEIYEECYGRTYYLRAAGSLDCEEWETAIKSAVARARKSQEMCLHLRLGARLQKAARKLYDGGFMQAVVSVLLIVNFVISIVQGELMANVKHDVHSTVATDERMEIVRTLEEIEMIFVFVFFAELLFNLYGHWFWPFFSSRWAWFDLIVVLASVVDAAYVLGGGTGMGLAVMRLLRIFRIVRIGHRLEHMKNILDANLSALGPMMNAFLLFVVVVAIYSVVAVNLFDSDSQPVVGACNYDGACFQSFSVSFYTLLGLATGESWTPYVHSMLTDNGHVDPKVVIFFLSYVALVGIVAVNIIVAVLLENFVSSMARQTALKRIQEEAKEHHKSAGALDPLMATLANFQSFSHLNSQIDLLFWLWDVDDNGTINYEEMLEGMAKLNYQETIHLSSDDWEMFTLDGQLLDADGGIDIRSFRMAMRYQIADYAQRLLANKMQQAVNGENEHAPVLFAMKMAVMEIMSASLGRFKPENNDDNERLDSVPGATDDDNSQNDEPTLKDSLPHNDTHALAKGLWEMTSAVGRMTSRLEEVAAAQADMQTQLAGLQHTVETRLCVQ